MYLPDNYSLWESYDREQERKLMKLPVCCRCGERIQGEVYEVFFDELCEDCYREVTKEEWDDDED